MGMDAPATLRLLDKADREILALDRSVKGPSMTSCTSSAVTGTCPASG